jgi:hypothetical protein
MLHIIENLPRNVVGIEVSGEVTKEEYDETIVPRIDTLAEQQGEINYLLVIKTDISAFSTGVWWDDFKMAIKHFSKWNKIAIVTDQQGIAKFTDMFSFAHPGEPKSFKLDEYDKAVNWVSE